MDIRRISDSYSVSGQIRPDDVEAIRAAGFRSIISHRPDDEEPNQPTARSVEEAARRAGLGFRHIPVVNGADPSDAVRAMKAALDELEGPVFAYCRSGTRSSNIFAMAERDA